MPNPSELARIEEEEEEEEQARKAGSFDAIPDVFAPPRYEVRATVLLTSRWHVIDRERFGRVVAWCQERATADRIAALLNAHGE